MNFDIAKVEQVYDNYARNYHPGVTMVMGHPFKDEALRQEILALQEAIKKIFAKHHLDDLLLLYDADHQVHATVVELAGQHDKAKTTQRVLEDFELTRSSKTKKPIDIDYAVEWIRKTAPFDIELGQSVLSAEHLDQTLRITESGQIVMKGRAKDRKLLAEIRAEFEERAGIVHKYGKEDDEFFFVIGYLKPDFRLHDPQLLQDLETCINERRSMIDLALKVDAVKIIAYDNYSLGDESCLWESKELALKKEPDLPQKTLLDTIRILNEHLKEALEEAM